jgi:quercetin dioxygenase-like cupin family protein
MEIFMIDEISPNPSLPKRGVKRKICKKIPYCDFDEKRETKAANKTRLYKHKGNFTWQGIKTEKYKAEGTHWADVIRRFLIGKQNESTRFHLRYFEILPGGYSSFEKHKHEHVVVGIRGRGKVICGKRTHELNFLDTLYISPHTPHQLSNPFEEPFGFFCIVNAKRDKPKILTPPNLPLP